MTVRKGDAVVVEKNHTSTSIKMKVTRYTTFHVANVASVGRDGTVLGVIIPGLSGVTSVDKFRRVYTIDDEEKQEGARRLYNMVKDNGENEWPDMETMKKAIMESFMWQRVL